jgi:hypothetical protein
MQPNETSLNQIMRSSEAAWLLFQFSQKIKQFKFNTAASNERNFVCYQKMFCFKNKIILHFKFTGR